MLPLLTSTRPPKLSILLILLGLATAAVSGGVVREFCIFSEDLSAKSTLKEGKEVKNFPEITNAEKYKKSKLCTI